MGKPNKNLAFIAYLLSILGWLYVFLFHKEDKFAVYHAKQSMMLTIVAVAAPIAWAIGAWIVVLFIPLLGPITAASLFALVMLVYIFLAVIWIVGMVRARRADMKPLPVVGEWAERLPIGNEVTQ